MDTKWEIQRRRTFAIISHPDAGKTTLTEKFLLYGGAIQLAGSVKGKATARHAVSDWMELEKQRGISITSSVMQFEYDGYCINILDTPGHQDFSEDTYRTLMAADSAVMVIDAAKGIEPQTRKLFKVCAMRHIPIFTFINKLDREARDRDEREVLVFQEHHRGQDKIRAVECELTDTEVLDALIGERMREKLVEDIELLDGASYEFDLDAVQAGELSPVFFGSALTNFGVERFLQNFLKMTTPPLPRETAEETVDPFSEEFSAFVFKIQANMNKAHRDRIAFMRICSGVFQRDKEYYHVQGGKAIKLAQPQQMMAQERAIINEAFAGDIIGVFDPGIFSIGDTVCSAKKKVRFEGIPTFAPEHFSVISQVDTMKRKQFSKGVTQIAQEGAIQMFHSPNSGMEEVIVGAVGVLQFEVLEYRLRNEYNVDIRRRDLSYSFIRWIDETPKKPDELNLASDTRWVQDFQGRDLLLFNNEWSIRWAEQKNEGLKLSEFSKNW